MPYLESCTSSKHKAGRSTWLPGAADILDSETSGKLAGKPQVYRSVFVNSGRIQTTHVAEQPCGHSSCHSKSRASNQASINPKVHNRYAQQRLTRHHVEQVQQLCSNLRGRPIHCAAPAGAVQEFQVFQVHERGFKVRSVAVRESLTLSLSLSLALLRLFALLCLLFVS